MKLVRKMHLLRVLALFLVMAAIAGCKQDLNNISNNWSPEVGLPLLDADLSFMNLLTGADTQYVKVDKDRSLVLIYNTNLPTQSAAELLPALPAYHNQDSYAVPSLSFFQSHGAINDTISDDVDIDLGTVAKGGSIDEIRLKTGGLKISITSPYSDSVFVSIQIPGLKDQKGNGYRSDYDLTSNSGSKTVTNDIAMNGYTLDLTEGGTTHSKIKVTVIMRLKYVAHTPAEDVTGKSVNYSVDFTNISFSYVKGNFGNLPFALPASGIQLPAMSFLKSGSLTLDTSAKVNIDVYNSFGIPINVDLNKINAKYPNKTVTPIDSIFFPIQPQSAIGGAPTSNHAILNPNKFIQAIESKPDSITYGGTAIVGSGASSSNFVTDTSSIRASIKTRIPLKFSMKDLTLQDTIPASFSFNGIDSSRVDLCQFLFYVVNGFPFGVKLQMTLLDGNYHSLGTIVPAGSYIDILTAATPGFPGTAQTVTVNYISNSKESIPKMTALKNMKYMMVTAVLNTYQDKNGNYPAVQLSADSRLKVKVGTQLKYRPLPTPSN